MNLVIHQSMSALKELLASLHFSNNALVLWDFAAGAVAAKDMPERKWFVGHLVVMTEEMGVESWEAWRELVSRIVWHEKLCGGKYRAVWEEVEAKRRELGGE